MPDFDTRRPQESDEPNGLRSRSLTNRVRNSLIANRLRTLLIGGGILLCAVVGISVGLVTYSFGGPGALPQEPLGEVPNGKIAFLRVDRDIYVTNPDGTGVRNLTDTPRVGEDIPAWSPDGEMIAFEAYPPYDLYVMNADGSGRTQLTDTPEVAERIPAWSPDGEMIAVTTSEIETTRGEIYDLYVMNTDGSGRTNLTDTSRVDEAVAIFGSPVWSPDSEKIAFTRSIGEMPGSASATAASAPVASPQPKYDESGIYVVNADGSGQSSLINQPADRHFEAPAWSPDGEMIAFEGGTTQGTRGYTDMDDSYLRGYGDRDDIYVMNADGSGRTNLTDTSGEDEATPAWSPDGEMIAFKSGTAGKAQDIYVMNADGTGRRRLTNTAEATETNPTWSPDGEMIAFWSGVREIDPICVINADGTGRRCIAYDDDAIELLNGPGLAWGRG